MRSVLHGGRKQAAYIFNDHETGSHFENEFNVAQKSIAACIMKPPARTGSGKGLARRPAHHDVDFVIAAQTGVIANLRCVVTPDIANKPDIGPVGSNGTATCLVELAGQQKMNARLFQPQIKTHGPGKKRQGFEPG